MQFFVKVKPEINLKSIIVKEFIFSLIVNIKKLIH